MLSKYSGWLRDINLMYLVKDKHKAKIQRRSNPKEVYTIH